MKAGRFAIIDAAGAVLWAGIIGTAGYALAQAISRAWGNIRKHEDVIALGLLAVVSLIAMWRGRGAKGELKTLRSPGKLGIEAVSHVARGAGRVRGARGAGPRTRRRRRGARSSASR